MIKIKPVLLVLLSLITIGTCACSSEKKLPKLSAEEAIKKENLKYPPDLLDRPSAKTTEQGMDTKAKVEKKDAL